jgi:hypothetical protein
MHAASTRVPPTIVFGPICSPTNKEPIAAAHSGSVEKTTAVSELDSFPTATDSTASTAADDKTPSHARANTFGAYANNEKLVTSFALFVTLPVLVHTSVIALSYAHTPASTLFGFAAGCNRELETTSTVDDTAEDTDCVTEDRVCDASTDSALSDTVLTMASFQLSRCS